MPRARTEEVLTIDRLFHGMGLPAAISFIALYLSDCVSAHHTQRCESYLVSLGAIMMPLLSNIHLPS